MIGRRAAHGLKRYATVKHRKTAAISHRKGEQIGVGNLIWSLQPLVIEDGNIGERNIIRPERMTRPPGLGRYQRDSA
jgi:hypothetical protein